MKSRQPLLRNAILAGTLLCATAALSAKTRTNIHVLALIHLDEGQLHDLTMTVEANGTECLPYHLYSDGYFELPIPVDSRIVFHFETPGYATKEVVIDTRHAVCTPKAAKKNKLIRFEVDMVPLLKPARIYAQPVGSITFAKGTGALLVHYDRTMANSIALTHDPATTREE